MNLEPRVREAVRYFWSTRERQAAEQGGDSGKKDAGAQAAVTGGAQMNGFVRLVRDLLYDNGIKQGEIQQIVRFRYFSRRPRVAKASHCRAAERL
jgi:hypothetical protein